MWKRIHGTTATDALWRSLFGFCPWSWQSDQKHDWLQDSLTPNSVCIIQSVSFHPTGLESQFFLLKEFVKISNRTEWSILISEFDRLSKDLIKGDLTEHWGDSISHTKNMDNIIILVMWTNLKSGTIVITKSRIFAHSPSVRWFGWAWWISYHFRIRYHPRKLTWPLWL